MEHSLDTTRPYAGVPELLRELKERGRHIAVVSNKFDAATKSLCHHFFSGLIDVAVGEHEAEGIRKKPAPDTVHEALSQMVVSSAGAVYIGKKTTEFPQNLSILKKKKPHKDDTSYIGCSYDVPNNCQPCGRIS